ncbi:MAG TPA: hypothetical protein VD994_10595 [Prosthecobacter sp.]|nr:hypothetical protein [Prosthecobacter sp.]
MRHLILAALLSLFPLLAEAQSPQCGPRAQIVAHLSQEFKEAQVARGLIDNGGLAEVWATQDGATFTLLVTLPNGLSCFIATGSGWQPVEHKLPPAPEQPL